MIGRDQVQVISHLIGNSEQEVPIGVLAEQLDWSEGHTSRVVSKLETRGCVRTETVGRQKLASLSDIEPIEQLEALMTEYAHVDFPEYIAGSNLQLLYYLDHGRTATELADVSDVSRATVYRRLNDLQAVGIVGKSESRYELNEPFSKLSSIARGLVHHEHRGEAERYVDTVNILWENHREYLFACDGEVTAEEFHLTGASLFGEFDIPLLTRSRRHYFRSDRINSISPAELVCHTLLIADDSRYRTYSLLLIQREKIDRETLEACAVYYDPEADIDLLEIVGELIEYLNTNGGVTTDQLPPWEDFKSTAADYEIEI